MSLALLRQQLATVVAPERPAAPGLPTGIPGLDARLIAGGLPRGRLSELVGVAAAKGLASDVSEREASHLGFFDLAFAGQTEAAIAAMYAHLAAWPRDALVVASAANPNGLIGGSGRIGQKHQIAALMDSLAPSYDDDFWFVLWLQTPPLRFPLPSLASAAFSQALRISVPIGKIF